MNISIQFARSSWVAPNPTSNQFLIRIFRVLKLRTPSSLFQKYKSNGSWQLPIPVRVYICMYLPPHPNPPMSSPGLDEAGEEEHAASNQRRPPQGSQLHQAEHGRPGFTNVSVPRCTKYQLCDVMMWSHVKSFPSLVMVKSWPAPKKRGYSWPNSIPGLSQLVTHSSLFGAFQLISGWLWATDHRCLICKHPLLKWSMKAKQRWIWKKLSCCKKNISQRPEYIQTPPHARGEIPWLMDRYNGILREKTLNKSWHWPNQPLEYTHKRVS